MNQFQLSALLKFANGVSIGKNDDDGDCYWWSELENKGLITQTGTWFSATEAGLRVIEICTSCASNVYDSLRLGGLAK